jgi:hypothetical protein
MKKRSIRGEIATGILVGIAVAGVVAYLFKGSKMDGESRRAERSEEATKELETAVKKVEEAHKAKGAAAAASVSQIGTAAGSLPEDSRVGQFIAREVPVALTYLPEPDPKALLESGKRRLAVMEGKLAEAGKLYEAAYTEAISAKERAIKAEKERDNALAERRAADAAISEAAAVNRALAQRSMLQWFGIGLLALGAGYLWLTGISPRTIGRAMASIRAGEETPVQAFDRLLPDWMHARVQTAARLATPLAEDTEQTRKAAAANPGGKITVAAAANI